MSTAFFTIGYGGKSEDELLQQLKDAKIDMLVDVRWKPYCGWNKTFSKNNLSKFLSDNNINYVNDKRLGNPSKSLEKFTMRQSTMNALDELHKTSKNTGWKIVFLCSEKNYQACHRQFLTSWLENERQTKTIHL